MDEARMALVAESRGWLGTPYCHQASVRGAGCDCLGLIRGLWRARHGAEPAPLPPYGPEWAEAGSGELLWQAMAQHLRPAGAQPLAGDVLLFRLRQGAVAKHLGLLTETGPAPRFIHAYAGHGTVESPLSRPWARRIVARFDLT